MGKLRHYVDSVINFMSQKRNKDKVPLLYYWTKRYLFTLVIGLLIIGLVSIIWIRHNALQNRLTLTTLFAQEIAERASESTNEDFSFSRLPFLQDRQQFINPGQPLNAFIKNKDGEVISLAQRPLPNESQIISLIQSLSLVESLSIEEKILFNEQKASVVIAPIKEENEVIGSVYIIQPHAQLNHINKEEYQLLVLLLLGLAILGWLVIYFLSKKLAKPVEEVADAAQQLMSGNYDIHLNEDLQEKELHQLMLSFNEMTHRLKTLEGLRTQLLAGVTHELKTPITSISALIQAVNDNIIPEEKKKEFILMSLKEAKRLQSMVEDLLDFNSFSAGSIKVSKEKTTVQTILKEILYQWEIVHQEQLKTISITYTSPETPIHVQIDRVRFQQIMVNLLNNSLHALKAIHEAKLTIEVKYDVQYAYIYVEDNGYGIPEEEQPYIFERFYRGKHKKDIERGLGLGLPYSLLLAKALDGDLVLQNSVPSSTVFMVKIPVFSLNK